uniref:Uncharacterized protein n=1 Tax=Micrurus spixii TaxID=129469 RepID=A0A2D4LFY0_9SAUR
MRLSSTLLAVSPFFTTSTGWFQPQIQAAQGAPAVSTDQNYARSRILVRRRRSPNRKSYFNHFGSHCSELCCIMKIAIYNKKFSECYKSYSSHNSCVILAIGTTTAVTKRCDNKA